MLFVVQSRQTANHFNRLISSNPHPISFNISASDFLQYINPSSTESDSIDPNSSSLSQSFTDELYYLFRNARVISFPAVAIKLQIQSQEKLHEALKLLDKWGWCVQGNWVMKR